MWDLRGFGFYTTLRSSRSSHPEFLILGVKPSFNMPLFGTGGLTRIPKLNTEVCRKHVGHKQEIQTSHAKFLSAQTSGKCVKVRYVIVDNYWPDAAQCYAKTKLLVNFDDIKCSVNLFQKRSTKSVPFNRLISQNFSGKALTLWRSWLYPDIGYLFFIQYGPGYQVTHIWVAPTRSITKPRDRV